MGNMDYELISFQTAVTDIEDIIHELTKHERELKN